MKNLNSSAAGILNRTVAAMRLCFIALSMVSIPMFVKPAFLASYEFVTAVFPRLCETFSAWLTPTVLYVLVNCIILAILASSNLQHRCNITGSSHHEEHNPSAAHQKQQQEPIYEEQSAERSGTTELKEEEAEARSERIRTRDVRKVERPSATSRVKADYRRSASVKSATEANPLDILQSKEEAATLEATWKAITEGQRAPLTRHLRKSETWETVRRGDAIQGASCDSSSSSSSSVFRKSETFSFARNRTDNLLGGPEFSAGMRKEPSLSQDELNRRVEAFIAKVNNDMKLQREQSLARYMEMVNRGLE